MPFVPCSWHSPKHLTGHCWKQGTGLGGVKACFDVVGLALLNPEAGYGDFSLPLSLCSLLGTSGKEASNAVINRWVIKKLPVFTIKPVAPSSLLS